MMNGKPKTTNQELEDRMLLTTKKRVDKGIRED